MRVLLACLLFALGCASCPPKPEVCTPGESRCTGNRAELCSPDKSEWFLVMDCGMLDGTWTCAVTPEGHTCVLQP